MFYLFITHRTDGNHDAPEEDTPKYYHWTHPQTGYECKVSPRFAI